MPIGLAYIAAAVDEDRHQMRVLDLMFSDDGPADVEQSAVKDFQPDLVGLSITKPRQPELLQPGLEPPCL